MSNAPVESPELLALQKAINVAGSQAQLASKIPSLNPSTISVMLTRDKKASVKWVAKISEVTGIPCHELRPDIFPEPANEPSNQQQLEYDSSLRSS